MCKPTATQAENVEARRDPTNIRRVNGLAVLIPKVARYATAK